ncbi:DUF4382 domain-containing protein [Persicobacter psychrovividus]|uniref:DUF4382 domain-containing protein n=1 Tax=Persicobacter psychrovividus TaxID=387638 RepID=A0ABN6LD12_9BACT|nr:hypothetical protein PEPS_33680 [Persicobacter psychrovividus]
MKLNTFYQLIVLLVAMTFTACSSSDDNASTARLSVRMSSMEAPGNLRVNATAEYDSIILNIEQVRIKMSNEGSWITLENANPGRYNISNPHLDGLLGEVQLPEGEIKEIRFVLDQDNEIYVDGEQHDLKTPSAQTSGWKLKKITNPTIKAGHAYTLSIDLDPSSISHNNGIGYKLDPVASATLLEVGTVKGAVMFTNIEGIDEAYVELYKGDELMISTMTVDHLFVFPGLFPATYTVKVGTALNEDGHIVDGTYMESQTIRAVSSPAIAVEAGIEYEIAPLTLTAE